jgi:hypothetical protein
MGSYPVALSGLVILCALCGCNAVSNASDTFCNVTNTSVWKMTTSNAGKFPGRFILRGDAIESEPGQTWGVYWCNQPLPSDFLLRIEWLRHEADDNSGVFIRFPNPDAQHEPNTALVAARGFEIQIDELGSPDGAPYHRTGAIYGQLGQHFSLRPARPIGQWNVYEIEAKGQHYRVSLNGTLVSEFTNRDQNRAKPTVPGAPSYFGVQAERGHVEFRRVSVTKL